MKNAANADLVTAYLKSAYTNPKEINSVLDGRWKAKGVSEEAVARSWEFFHALYKDVEMNIVEQVSDDQSVFSLLKITAQADDGPCAWTAMHYHKVRDGVIQEGACGVHGAI